MRTIKLFLVILLFCTSAFAQDKKDIEAVNNLLDKYLETEIVGDMVSQVKLMTDDRVYVGPDGRTTNQKLLMGLQQAQIENENKTVPGVKYFIDDRDRLVKFYGNVCVASFYRFTNVVLPVPTPPEIAKEYATPIPPVAITLVIAKGDGNWKIVHTHVSQLPSLK